MKCLLCEKQEEKESAQEGTCKECGEFVQDFLYSDEGE